METIEMIILTFLASVGVSAILWIIAELITHFVENKREAQQERMNELKRINDQIDRINKTQERINELLTKRM